MSYDEKDDIAYDMYGDEYKELNRQQKAAVTRKYKAVANNTNGITATIGRIGDNGTKTCILEQGATIEDLLEQSGYDFDVDKEGIIAQSTGTTVDLDDEAVNNEVYAIAVEIKSADLDDEEDDDEEDE